MKKLVVLFLFAFIDSARAEDWPTYGHDNRRSHVSNETLPFPLEKSWSWQSPVPPQTAWTGPARWDAYAANEGLQSMRNFDPAFFVTSVGDSVFFGSSADHGVHCLSAASGEERWVTFADGRCGFPRPGMMGGSISGQTMALRVVSTPPAGKKSGNSARYIRSG